MVEFALVAPFLFLLIFGLAILGIAIANQIQLSNAVRDGARAAAICGGAATAAVAGGTGTALTPTLPDGSTCTTAHLVTYINHSLALIPDASPQIGVQVSGPSGGALADLTDCQAGSTVEVKASFRQPLYLPLVGYLLGDPNDATVRTLNADAEATCEQ
jgi:Flp pilus assembly protein TadG